MITYYDPKEILEQYADTVYQLALVQMKNKPDAEDIFQDVFLRLVNKNPGFESKAHVKAWLIRVTLNCCHSKHRSFWSKKTVPLAEAAEIAEEAKEDSELYTYVLELSPKERTIIDLFYFEDMSLEEISHTLKISYPAAAKRLSRAREHLKKKLEEENCYERLSGTAAVKKTKA